MQGSHRDQGQGMSRVNSVRAALAAAVNAVLLTGILLGAAAPAVSATSSELTLPELQKALASHPDAKWRAAAQRRRAPNRRLTERPQWRPWCLGTSNQHTIGPYSRQQKHQN